VPDTYGSGLAGFTILLRASMTSRRLGTGISKPLGVFCFGSCGFSVIHGEVSAYG